MKANTTIETLTVEHVADGSVDRCEENLDWATAIILQMWLVERGREPGSLFTLDTPAILDLMRIPKPVMN